MLNPSQTSRSHRLELVLRQIDALATLPSIAIALLRHACGSTRDPRELVMLLACDPVMTARLLALRRRIALGGPGEGFALERTIARLGGDAVRTAVLSVKVLDRLAHDAAPESHDDQRRCFRHVTYWRHSVMVALAAEHLAGMDRSLAIDPGDAYVAGLLHDLGKLALDAVLPKSFDRAIEMAQTAGAPLAEQERQVLGMDHHTAGKRLCEQWRLPHALADTLWLHGAAYESLPPLGHRKLVGLIHLADALAQRVTPDPGPEPPAAEEVATLAERLELDAAGVKELERSLPGRLEQRWGRLGLDQMPTRGQLLEAMRRANDQLGQLNDTWQQRARQGEGQAQALEAISAFHAQATPGRNVQDVVNAVVGSAVSVLGIGFYAMIYPIRGDQGKRQWVVSQYDATQRCPLRLELIDPPPHVPDLAEMDPMAPASMAMTAMVPWVIDYLSDAPDVRDVQWLPLGCGWGTAALLLHDRRQLPAWSQLGPLTATWGSAIAAAAQHDGARRLGESLAEANLALAQAQDRLLQSESLARLGQMAVGAAHEMNNPLAVISGRAQMLVRNLDEGDPAHRHAATIVEQAHRLSDLITLLKLFAAPPPLRRRQADLGGLLRQAVEQAVAQHPTATDQPVHLDLPDALPVVSVDSAQLTTAVTELVRNGLESSPQAAVTVSARISDADSALLLTITDTGPGMDPHTLSHAMDPFFSAKPAGRRVGMGLPRAQQIIAGHGGKIVLRSAAGRGTVVHVTIPLDSPQVTADT